MRVGVHPSFKTHTHTHTLCACCLFSLSALFRTSYLSSQTTGKLFVFAPACCFHSLCELRSFYTGGQHHRSLSCENHRGLEKQARSTSDDTFFSSSDVYKWCNYLRKYKHLRASLWKSKVSTKRSNKNSLYSQ